MGRLGIWGTSLVGCAALTAACGGAATRTAPGGETNGGATAEASSGTTAGGETSGGTTAKAGAGGAGGASPVDIGGEAGATPAGGAVQQAAERGLAPDEVELRTEVLAGHGFSLLSSLCPQSDWDWLGEDAGSVAGEARSLKSVHVRAGRDGELELVTLTTAGGVPKVQVAPLRQVGLGYSASEVATCAALVGYEDFKTRRYVARDMHLVFRKSAESLTAVVAATASDEPATSESKVDQEPPHLRPVVSLNGGEVDNVGWWLALGHLFFDEPVVEADLGLIGPNEEEASWKRLSEGGFVTGYQVQDVLSSDFRIVGAAHDLSGNELIEQRYPGIDSIFSDGNFEGAVALRSSDEFEGQGAPNCDGAGVLPSTTGSWHPLPEVPPIAGEQSLLITPGCTFWLRIPRQPGATKLRFEMQRLAGEHPLDDGSFTASVTSLGVGGDRIDTQLSMPAELEEPVGSIVAPSASLPATGDDLWVSLYSRGYFWLDSLRTE